VIAQVKLDFDKNEISQMKKYLFANNTPKK